MQPDDRLDILLLDTLLSERTAKYNRTPDGEKPLADPRLEPLLDVAGRLDILRDATPSPVFAADLERRLLSRMERHGATSSATPRSWLTRGAHAPSRLAWAGIAAALALTIGLGVFTAQAAPGQPLYVVRQFAQHLSEQPSGSASVEAHDALAQARADLGAYNQAIAAGDTQSALRALHALTKDDARAARAIATASDPGAAAQLAQLRQEATVSLRASLTAFDWQGRAEVTDTLRGWGATTLAVSNAVISSAGASGDSTHVGGNGDVTVDVNGAGFASGDQLLLNGQAVGTIVTVTPTQIEAQVPASALAPGRLVIGIEAADGTVAITSHIQNDGHGASGHDTSGSHDGSHPGSESATPSPSAPEGQGSPQG